MIRPENNDGNARQIRVPVPITARQVAVLMKIRPFRIITELAKRGGYAGMNDSLNVAAVRRLAKTYQLEVEIVHESGPGANEPRK
jgi:hypothetical protein